MSSCREGGFSIQSLGLLTYMFFVCPVILLYVLKSFYGSFKQKKTKPVYFYLIIRQMGDIICHIFIL